MCAGWCSSALQGGGDLEKIIKRTRIHTHARDGVNTRILLYEGAHTWPTLVRQGRKTVAAFNTIVTAVMTLILF